MFKKAVLYYSIFILCIATTVAQQYNLPLNREFNITNQKVFNDYNNNIHTSFSPLIQSFIKTDSISLLSSEQPYYLTNTKRTRIKNRSWFARKLFHENFIVVDTGKFYLTIDPLFNLETGIDNEDVRTEKPTLYTNTRGIIVQGSIGQKFSFQTSVYETQSNLPNYLVDYVQNNNVVPGQGRVKSFKENGVDYNSATANISYTPAKFINLQLGNGKNFIGDGYRSLLLSDASYNYPYFKITTLLGKKNQFQYTKLNASLSNLVRREKTSSAEALFTRKSMSAHYFNWIPTKWLSMGLFESTIWQTENSSGTKPYNFQQLNPIIGLNTLTTGFNENNHSLIGSNVKIKLPFKTTLYNQFIYDGDSKYGYQVGIKYFGVKHLMLQVEYNSVEPYTYSSNTTLQNYSHFNEALAHPLGTNFSELIGIINYKYKRIFIQIKVNIANTETIGNNIFVSENDLVPLIESADIQTITIQAHLGYLINPKNNMSIVLGITNRGREISRNPNFNDKTNYIYFALRTSLRNLYSDF